MDSADTPHHLAELNLAITPLQFFEHADRLSLEAAKIRDFSDELRQRAQSMAEKASQLQNTASELQHMGVQDRAQISKSYERILQEHETNLPGYKLAKPEAVEELGLAVEEGRVLLEEVEVFGDRLRSFAQSCTCLTGDSTNDEDVKGILESGSGSADARNDIAIGPKVNLCDDYHDQIVTSSGSSSDDIGQPAFASSTEADTVSVILRPSTAKHKRASGPGCKSSDVDEAPASKRVRRQSIRKSRKTLLFRRMGYDDSDMSEALLHSVKTPPRRSGKQSGRNKVKRSKEIV